MTIASGDGRHGRSPNSLFRTRRHDSLRILGRGFFDALLIFAFDLALTIGPAVAQQATTIPLATMIGAEARQTTGVPGSPGATRTIDGRYLPPQTPPFGGEINLNTAQSEPWWTPRAAPPKGAPNILLIMTDDVGFAAPSTFGGVIPTPTLDRIANEGLRYTNFHSTSLCSPTRAALITGRNHHSVGFGVVSEAATGFPGYDSYIGKDTGTPVDDRDYKMPFAFTGKIDKLTIIVDPPQLTPEDGKRLREAQRPGSDTK